MAGASTSFPTVEAFYAADDRRRRSPELDFGVWWRHRGVVYRLTWVDATGELIAVQLTPPRAEALVDPDNTWPVGFAVYGGTPESVYVLGVVRDRDVVERLLEGWAEVCGPDSLAWVLERLEALA